MGGVELDDQRAGVAYAVGRGLAAAERVGIMGWSYGGYMSAMALCKHPDVFRVGIAGAPVTSWDGYDTHYTERYMGLPQENEEGYRASSVMTHVHRLAGKLMVIQGLLDENVRSRGRARWHRSQCIRCSSVRRARLRPLHCARVCCRCTSGTWPALRRRSSRRARSMGRSRTRSAQIPVHSVRSAHRPGRCSVRCISTVSRRCLSAASRLYLGCCRYELLAFPDERHLPRSVADRVYMEQRVMSFVAKHL